MTADLNEESRSIPNLQVLRNSFNSDQYLPNSNTDIQMHFNDEMYVAKMSQLTEKSLLMKGKWVVAICFIMSIVGCLFPYG